MSGLVSPTPFFGLGFGFAELSAVRGALSSHCLCFRSLSLDGWQRPALLHPGLCRVYGCFFHPCSPLSSFRQASFEFSVFCCTKSYLILPASSLPDLLPSVTCG